MEPHEAYHCAMDLSTEGPVDGETNTYYPSLGPPASNVLPPPCPSFKKNNFLEEKQHMVSAALI